MQYVVVIDVTLCSTWLSLMLLYAVRGCSWCYSMQYVVVIDVTLCSTWLSLMLLYAVRGCH